MRNPAGFLFVNKSKYNRREYGPRRQSLHGSCQLRRGHAEAAGGHGAHGSGASGLRHPEPDRLGHRHPGTPGAASGPEPESPGDHGGKGICQ